MGSASLDLLFRPTSIAVIGAATNPRNLGHRIVRNLVDAGFAGPVFPVHPQSEKIADLPAYPAIAAVPEAVSLALVCVPRQAVLEVVGQCAAARVGVIVVVSAGFAEADDEGARLQDQLAALARRQGLRIVGPNCVGVINTNPAVRLNTTFCPLTTRPGRVALCSQSGALGVLALAQDEGFQVGFSQFVSVGNEADVTSAELLEYWGQDDATGVILLYLESVTQAARFRAAAQRVCRDKPVVAIKAGRAEAGGRAARSHTAAVTSNEQAIEALFQQTGIVRAAGLDEMLELAALFAHQPLPSGRRVGIVTNAGGPAVLCSDACAEAGLDVPRLSPDLQHQLARFLAPPASLANPVDMLASAGPAQYRQATQTLLSCDEVDAVIVIYVPVEMVAQSEIVDALRAGVAAARSASASRRPVVACVMTKSGERLRIATPDETVPCCIAPGAAAQALGKAAAYAQWRRQPRGRLPRLADGDVAQARGIIAAARGRTADGWLPPDSVRQLADALGWPLVAGAIAVTPDEAVEAARQGGFPVALKTASPRILHKTDIGAVELPLSSEEEVRAAFARLIERVGAHSQAAAADGVLVQPVCTGVELMIGALRDPQLGPLLALGLGGTHVEIIRDVCHRLAPLTDREAHEMVRAIRGYTLLTGHRGQPPADVPAVEQLLLRVSQFVTELPEVAELDLNPVMALPGTQGCRIVDARIRVTPSHAAADA